MKKSWYVHLIRQPVVNEYRSKYFPRKFYYKKDAEELKREVESKGGLAIVTNTPTSS